jgi:hypothetical protein
MFIDDHAFECRFFLGEMIQLGMTYKIAAQFLSLDLVLPYIALNKTVILWEGKDIAVGKIIGINNQKFSEYKMK